VYTLPRLTTIRIRKPSKPLVALVEQVLPEYAFSKLTVELKDHVTRGDRTWGPKIHRWFDFTYGRTLPIDPSERSFEIEPGYGLFVQTRAEAAIFVTSFAFDPLQAATLDIARDALFSGRAAECTRIAREALPHGWPLFVALIERETRRPTS